MPGPLLPLGCMGWDLGPHRASGPPVQVTGPLLPAPCDAHGCKHYVVCAVPMHLSWQNVWVFGWAVTMGVALDHGWPCRSGHTAVCYGGMQASVLVRAPQQAQWVSCVAAKVMRCTRSPTDIHISWDPCGVGGQGPFVCHPVHPDGPVSIPSPGGDLAAGTRVLLALLAGRREGCLPAHVWLCSCITAPSPQGMVWPTARPTHQPLPHTCLTSHP